MQTKTFNNEAMVRGYHVYKDIWGAALGEQLSCQREPRKNRDPFIVVVVRSLVTFGHVPMTVSSVCSMFLLQGETITRQVTASRRYSGDLPQGGLEIPCMLMAEKDITKISRLVKYALSSHPEVATMDGTNVASTDEPPKKKKRCDSRDGSVSAEAEVVRNCLTSTLTSPNDSSFLS